MGAAHGDGGRLVGRGTLTASLAEAMVEGGGAVLHGPTGVGKTALARHAVAGAEATGRASVWIQGTPGMSAVPLGALVPHLVGGGDPGGAAAEADTAALAHRLLRTLPGAGPVCVLDDLQWVDELSVGVAQQLRQVADLSVLATVRDGERLSPSAVSFSRGVGLVHLAVDPLPPTSVRELVAAWLGGPADAELVGRIAARAEGNPLFVTELLAGASSKGALH